MKSHTPSAPAGHRFKFVGLHIDLRIQVMPFEALCHEVREAARMGFNTLLIEWEATFPFRKHAVISNAFAYTPEEIKKFIGLCSQLGIQVIPLQQCFGHVEYILRHSRYASLRESRRNLPQVCPGNEAATEVFTEIFEEIAAAHPSPYMHIGGDETPFLGHCPKCEAKVREVGKSALYVGYLRRIAERVIAMGKTPLVWADMLLLYPEAAASMPKETIFIDWNYGRPVDKGGDPVRLKDLQFRMWGAPAMRSGPDNHWLACWHKHFMNLRDYVPYTKAMGFEGIILTSWSMLGVYGLEWDSWTTVREMFPIDRRYPHAGFRILQAAFIEAVSGDAPLDPEAFVTDYAQERFGLDANGGRRLWRALTLGEAEAVADNWPAARKPAAEARRILLALQPRRNIREFSHLRLMADLRDHHIRFRLAELACFSHPRPPSPRAVEKLLPPLLAEAGQLQRRFAALNKDAIYSGEMPLEEEYRFGGIRKLRARLGKTGRTGGRTNTL
jgi:hypothetical protein